MLDYGLLRCVLHNPRLPLRLSDDSQHLLCPEGHKIPIVKDIPRFVPDDAYAAAFGAQWKRFRRTQLDSYTGTSISEDRLTRLAGGTLEVVRGKQVLEAGCGAGRFTEVLLKAGAHVLAVDISQAVEANHDNCQRFPHYQVCQADIRHIPVEPEQFDVVVCVGVIQHTPDPEETIAALCGYVKPGGLLVIDHYTQRNSTRSWIRRLPRLILLRFPPWLSLLISEGITTLLWPLHRLLWNLTRQPVMADFFKTLRAGLRTISPVVDYHDKYPELRPEHLREWAILDLHDGTTDVFKHNRTAEEITAHLQACGMEKIETEYAGNGVEARARKPLAK